MVLPKRMDIFFSAKVKEAFLEALDKKDFTLDFKEVKTLDTSGIQLLLSFIKSVDKQIVFLNVSEDIAEITDLFGIKTRSE